MNYNVDYSEVSDLLLCEAIGHMTALDEQRRRLAHDRLTDAVLRQIELDHARAAGVVHRRAVEGSD